MSENLNYHIALTALPSVGDRTAKKLIAYCGSSAQVFKEKKNVLEKIPGIGEINAAKINHHKKEASIRAEEEMKFIADKKIKTFYFLDDNYPERLFHCEDGPILLFGLGNVDYNKQKVISIVGTRRATAYGKDFCNQLIKDLTPYNPLIVSGLAYGIDGCAHQAAIKNGLSTVAVLGHGLDRIYPLQHTSLAKKMLNSGGLLTDYSSGTIPDRENFPKRNRIVAGLSELTVVVESSRKGGSLITAYLANDYNRDVFALPGRISDTQSEGCNHLIKTNKAALIHSAKDIEYIMGWEAPLKENSKQKTLFVELSTAQLTLKSLLLEGGQQTIDTLALRAKMPMSKTAATLLELEFKGVIKVLPGKRFELN